MPITDDLLTTLLENVKVNVQDAANFATLTDFKRAVSIMPEFCLDCKATPNAVIVPGEPEDEKATVSTHTWWQPITVYITHREKNDPQREKRVVGLANTRGLNALAWEVRKALTRESPYNNGKPTATPTVGTYTAQTGVLRAVWERNQMMPNQEKTTYQDHEGNPISSGPFDVCAVQMKYLCVEARA